MLSIDTKNSPRVTLAVRALFREMFPQAAPEWLGTLFRDVESVYSGGHQDYLPCDLGYHDLEHTLQVTLCFARLLAGRQRAGVAPAITPRQFELGLAGVLLHDVGYLKLRSDTDGTGAKYTYTHVMRSCAFAAVYLPRLGVNLDELQGVLGAIKCTGSTKEVALMHFSDPVEKMIACATATADYLGQMAAPDYPDELEILYHEFEESHDYIHTAPTDRPFRTARDLVENTPEFWTHVVLPKLEKHFDSMYRFLADPYPDGPNPYLEAIERNIAEVKRRLTLKKKNK